MKLFNKIAIAAVGAFMAIGVSIGVAANHELKGANAAAQCSVTFANSGYSNQEVISTVELDDNVTLTFDKGSGSTTPKYYTTGTAIRLYAKGTMTFAAKDGLTYKGITLTFASSGDGSNAITASTGSFTSPSWSGTAESVVLTIGGTSGNRRIAGVSVTYELEGTDTTSVSINQISGGYSLDADGSGNISATFTGSANSGTYAIWQSSNENAVLIDPTYVSYSTSAYFATQYVTGTSGSSDITVTIYHNGKEYTDTKTFTIGGGSSTISVTGVTLDQTRVDATVGDDPVTLTATVSPSNATNKSVTWSSDDTSVVTVANGVVTIVGAGTAVVTVTTVDGSKTAECVFQVEGTPVEGDAIAFNVGSDTSTSTSITKSGVTIAQQSGSTAYTFARTDNYRFYAGTFTISSTANPIIKIEFTCTASGSASYGPGLLSASVGSYSVSEKVGTWSGNSASVLFTASGQVRCTQVIVTLSDETPTELTGVVLDTSMKIINASSSASLTATYAPSSLEGVTVTWSSSDETVATVSSSGVVTTTTVLGTAVITVTATKGSNSFNATCSIANVQHAGTLADPFDVTDAINVAKATGNTATSSKYYVSGVVGTVSITSTYANATLVDGEKTLTLYRFYDEGTTNVSFTDTNKIKVNDTIVVLSSIVNFNNATPETTGGNLVSVTSSVTLTSVEIRGSVTTEVTVGDKFDLSELTIYAVYSDGSEVDVTSAATKSCTPDTATEAGTTTITVSASYSGVDATSRQFDVTVNAASATAVTDVLTREDTGITSGVTSYSSWSGVTKTSAAVYAGNSAGSNDSIQFRSTSPSGIVSTTSGGIVTKVAVEWESHTSTGRVLNVYGSNSAYSSGADLYDTSKYGTLIGTIVCGTSTELKISSNYQFIGIRSNSGAIYLSSISISWEAGEVETINVTGVSLDKTSETLEIGGTTTLTATVAPSNATNKNITWSSSNTSVATVNNGVVTAVAAGTADITVTTEDGSFTATCAITVNSGAVVGNEATINFKNTSDIVGEATDDQITWSNNGVTVVANKNSGTKVTNYYPGTSGQSYTETRLYKSNTLVFTAPTGKVITSISMTITTTNNGGLNSSANWSDGVTATGESGSVTATVSNKNTVTGTLTGTIKLLSVTVTFGDADENELAAIEWAESFLAALTCDQGATTPSTSVWSAQASAYAELSEGAKTIIVSATYSISGNGASTVVTAGDGVNQKIAEAVARYDYVVAKYGTTNYSNFISRTISSNVVTEFRSVSNETVSIVLVAIALLGITSVGAYFYLRKKKEN